MTPAERVGGIQAPADTAPASQRDETERMRAEVLRLAQEFEAVLLTQMLKDMRRSMVDPEDDTSEFGAMTDTFDTEFGKVLSASGGFGLSGALLKALERQALGAGTEPASRKMVDAAAQHGIAMDASAVASVAAAIAPRASLGTAESMGPVTSDFGWRKDPLTGTRGFHAGVDVGMAYGMEVRAVAAGRVTFAGERGGYGNMVAVKHDDGRETRYAHLASHDVREGDIVVPDQVLGRSGSSGRATGPHLHFEVLVNGRPVDPFDRGVDR